LKLFITIVRKEEAPDRAHDTGTDQGVDESHVDLIKPLVVDPQVPEGSAAGTGKKQQNDQIIEGDEVVEALDLVDAVAL
jgi:hypothetical protein